MVCQEGSDHVLVFEPAERARGVKEPAARADECRELREESELFLGGLSHLARARRPFEMRRAAPGPRAAARRVDQHTVVGRRGGRAAEDGDGGGAGAGGADLKFTERCRPNIKGIDAPFRAEERGQLERFAARTGAGVEPMLPGGDRGGFKNQL